MADVRLLAVPKERRFVECTVLGGVEAAVGDLLGRKRLLRAVGTINPKEGDSWTWRCVFQGW